MKAISDLLGAFLVTVVTGIIGVTLTGSWGVLGAIVGGTYLGLFVWLAIVFCCVEFQADRFGVVTGHPLVKRVGACFQIWFTYMLAPAEHSVLATCFVFGLWLIGVVLKGFADGVATKRATS